MTNEQKFDLKNKFINCLGKRVFDICFGCISKINCNSKEYENGFILTVYINFYNNRPTLIRNFAVYYDTIAPFFYNELEYCVIDILKCIYKELYKELDK